MKKKILLTVFFLFLIMVVPKLYKMGKHYLREKAQKEYEATLVDTSSPTVTVLRDFINVGYRNEKKTLHIYVPPSYNNDTTQRYPVMYFMDGESCYNDLENMAPEWEIDEVINAADASGKQTAIVIGINQAEDRNAEYTPFLNEDNPDAHGEQFAKWVATDLKKYVDENYKTKTEATATTIGGISRSGMMAYYILMEHPNVFGNAVIQSPSMWVDYDKLMGMTLSDQELANKKFFISVGEKEGNMVELATDLYKKFEALGLSEAQLHLEIIPDEAHWHPTWRKSFAVAYPWLMDD